MSSSSQGNFLFRREFQQISPIKSVFITGTVHLTHFLGGGSSGRGRPWDLVPEDIKKMFFSDTFGIPRPVPVHFRPAETIEKEPNASIPNGGRLVYTFYAYSIFIFRLNSVNF